MLKFDEIFKNISWLIFPIIIALLGILVIHITIGNTELFILLNTSGWLKNDLLWANITILGDALFFAAFLLPFSKKYPQLIWAAFLSSLFGVLFSIGGKWLFGIPRPDIVLSSEFINKVGQINTDFSFPSGHTTSVYMLAGLFIFTIKEKKWRLLLLLTAFPVGFSRIMVGAHWPMDIFGGIISGLLAAYLGLTFRRYWSVGTKPILRYFLLAILILCTLFLILYYDSGYPDVLFLQRGLAAVLLFSGLVLYIIPSKN